MKIHGPLESTAVQELLNHSRGFQLNLNEENIFHVLQAAGMFQFKTAKEACCAFLKVIIFFKGNHPIGFWSPFRGSTR